MPVVSADGKAYKPVVIFPGKLSHYRTVAGSFESVHSVLMDWYLSHCEVRGADSDIICQWAMQFLEETKTPRQNRQYIMLVLDGYSAHVHFPFLHLMMENHVIVMALPAHASQELQPLDVTVFGPYKSYLQQELHRVARITSILNVFDVGQYIQNAYSRAFISPVILEGFIKYGLWDISTKRTSIGTLNCFSNIDSESNTVSMTELVSSFNRNYRALLFAAEMEEEGRVQLNTASGARLTDKCVVSALQIRHTRRKNAAAKKSKLQKHKL